MLERKLWNGILEADIMTIGILRADSSFPHSQILSSRNVLGSCPPEFGDFSIQRGTSEDALLTSSVKRV